MSRVGDPVRVALLGSTGSIGRQTLDVLLSAGPEAFRVVALAAGRDVETFTAQAGRLPPAGRASLADPAATARLEPPAGVALDRDPDALTRFATRDDVDLVIVATGGVVSLRPVLAALRAGKVVATANKETLVAGGHLVMPLARAAGRRHVPRVDPADPWPARWPGCGPSTPSTRPSGSAWPASGLGCVARLLLTASGGPFRDWSPSASRRPPRATPWPTRPGRMGAKITIDSATLMNKGLEVIEARWLYDVAYERIDVVIHPQSLVHSLVEFVDGSLKAQLGLPDMRIPIQYALTWPRRIAGTGAAARPAGPLPDDVRAPRTRPLPGAGHRARGRPAGSAGDRRAHRRGRGRRGRGSWTGGLTFPGIARLVADAVERFGDGPEPDVEDLLEPRRARCAPGPAPPTATDGRRR